MCLWKHQINASNVKCVHKGPPRLPSYIHTHAHTHSLWPFAPMSKEFDEFFAGIAWQENDISVSRGWVGWMDGRMTPVSIPTGERKSLSEHNRKETEQKQAYVFLDIKSLPVGHWAASPTILSLHLSAQFNHPFGRQRNWSSLFICVHKKCACSCGYISKVLHWWVK